MAEKKKKGKRNEGREMRGMRRGKRHEGRDTRGERREERDEGREEKSVRLWLSLLHTLAGSIEDQRSRKVRVEVTRWDDLYLFSRSFFSFFFLRRECGFAYEINI